MSFTEEQLIQIRTKIKQLQTRREQLEKENNSNSKELFMLANELREYINMISDDKKNDSIIVNLSKFKATIDFLGFKETYDYFLCDDEENKIDGYMTITRNCPLAKSVIGKKENDNFKYEVNGTIITGVVDKIYEPVKVYTKTIEK